MKIRWSHFDNFSAKLAAWLAVAGSLTWIVYEIRHHYHTKATSWDWFPFVVGGLFFVFGLAILSRKATAGATDVLLPLLDRLPWSKKTTTSSVLVPPQPAQPAQPAKVVTTTVTPVPGTQPPEQEGA